MDPIIDTLPDPKPVFIKKSVRNRRTRNFVKKFKRTVIKLLITLLIITGSLTYGAYKLNEWFSSHELIWRTPIQMPVQVVPRRHPESKLETGLVSEVHAASPGDERTNNATIRSTDVSKSETSIDSIVSAVYRLESSGGKNDSCRARGQYNGYGYAPGTCYKSHAAVEQLVTKWFERTLKTYDLPTALCSYNLGFTSPNVSACVAKSTEYPYYRDYLNLN